MNEKQEKVMINGRLHANQKEVLESKAKRLGYIYNDKGSLFALLAAIADDKVKLTRIEETV